MDRHRLRIVALALALGALVALVAAIAPRGERAEMPEPIESVFPLPGDTVVRQTAIEVDLPVGYTLEIYVDGERVPPVEIGVTSSTGVWLWQPGPGRSLEQWEAGEHTVRVVWRTTAGRPDPGEFSWTFRVA